MFTRGYHSIRMHIFPVVLMIHDRSDEEKVQTGNSDPKRRLMGKIWFSILGQRASFRLKMEKHINPYINPINNPL